MDNKIKILIVDDETETAQMIANYLRRRGYEAQSLDNPLVALETLSQEKFDIIISDINMPQMNGLEFVKKAKEISSDFTIILLTAYGSLGTAQKAIKIGVADYLLKPVQLEELSQAIDKAVKKHPQDYTNLKKDLEQTKNEFLTLISHELRTPVAIISESFSLLKEIPSDDKIKGLSEEQKNTLFASIEGARQRLSSIIEDLTYYLSFDKNPVKLNKERVVLNQFLESNFAVLEKLTKKSKVVLKKKIIQAEQLVEIDKEKILDLLTRLIYNAVYHNPEGVKVEFSLSSLDDGFCRIEISDNGRGIEEKVLDNLFEPFRVGDIDHHSKGIGISLAICKRLVDLHSGKIKIESKAGQGAKVIIDLPKLAGGAK